MQKSSTDIEAPSSIDYYWLMTPPFRIKIPAASAAPLEFVLELGQVVYLLGANGTGKSSLVSLLFTQHQKQAKRISAHRQTWFESNTLNITPHKREQLEINSHSQDAHPQARYTDWNAGGRANMSIFDLIDADTNQERMIAKLVRAKDTPGAEKAAETPSPIQVINELMRLSNIPIEISIEEGQKVVARKNNSADYSVAELSDGERNAFLIAADVLTAKSGTLILIDEPERHLHRSIISPLLKLLFDRRDDCAFIVSTHEPMLPLDTPKASVLLVRSCDYERGTMKSWAVDMLEPGVAIGDDLKADILGSRQKVLFVEGTFQSIDLPLYSILFPQVSIIPKNGCREVEHAVRALRGETDLHWISAYGIVDNDQRSTENVDRLREAFVWALTHYSVESLYYHPCIIERLAERQANLVGGDRDSLVSTAITDAIAAAVTQRDHLVKNTVVRSARKRFMEKLPTRKDVETANDLKVEVDVAVLRAEEERRFDALALANDWDALVARYPLRESSAFKQVIDGLCIKDQQTYQAAVLKLLQDDLTAVEDLRKLLGDLYQIISLASHS